MRVLVVCHGNVCRSPLAGAVLARALGEENVRDRGVGPVEGRLAAKKVRTFAAGFGYDLSQHRSRRCTEADISWANIVLYMDGGNLQRLAEWPTAVDKAVCLGQYVRQLRIPDPAFTPNGPKLAEQLALCHLAATLATNALLNEKPPRG